MRKKGTTTQKTNALELAIQNGHPEIVKILLDKLSELLDDPLNSTDFSKLFKTANKVLQEPLNAVKSDYKYKTQLRDAKKIAETALKETETKLSEILIFLKRRKLGRLFNQKKNERMLILWLFFGKVFWLSDHWVVDPRL